MAGQSEIPEAAPIAPDTRDWTFVITEGCEECGFRPFDSSSTGDRLRTTIPAWRRALASLDASVRPEPLVWSPLEYACHVRDVSRLFRSRLELMLNEDDPVFDNWDQDATAVEDDYYHQDPALVIGELESEFLETASAFDAVRVEQRKRLGRRRNGSVFTVDTLGVYFIHDVEHHLYDLASR